MTEDPSRFCCMNEQRHDRGRRGVGNLTVRARHGKVKQRRLLDCRSCEYRPSEREGTPPFGSQLTEQEAVSIFEHPAERNGVRATAGLVKVDRNAVARHARPAGEHARRLHDEVVAFSNEGP